MEDHVHRAPEMGTWVLINARWYKVQGLNDFLVTSVTAVTALSSGAIFIHFGWGILTGATVVPLLLVFLAILWASKNHAMAS